MPQLLWQLNLFWRFRPVFAGNRTTDPLHTWRTLYQLRHSDGFKAQIMMALPVNLFTSFVGYIFISEKIKRLWNWNCAYVMKDSVIERNRFIFLRDLQWMCLLIIHEELTFKSQSTALYHNRTNPSNTMDTWKDWSLIFKVATLSRDVINTFRKNVNFSTRIRHFNIPVCLFVLQTYGWIIIPIKFQRYSSISYEDIFNYQWPLCTFW